MPCLPHAASVSFIKNVPKKAKGKRQSPPAPLPTIALDITETAMYESLDNEDPFDYTYPKPSPTSKQHPDSSMYTYIPSHRDEGATGRGEDLYHVVGPEHVQSSSRDQAPPPVPLRNGSVNNGGNVIDSSGFYHLLEGGNGSILYEDPTLPAFRVRGVYHI